MSLGETQFSPHQKHKYVKRLYKMKSPKRIQIFFSSSHATFTKIGHKLLELEEDKSIGSTAQNFVP